MDVKKTIARLPIIGPLARQSYRRWFNSPAPFVNSTIYWKNRYDSGGNSGHGSYDQLAKFKATILNDFVLENSISTVIEYGCGDGNQLKLANYPHYIGFDISPLAISICSAHFAGDASKTFQSMESYQGQTAELTLSLDVIYHLIEDSTFSKYMILLFDTSKRFVIIYSSNTDNNANHSAQHVKHRKFSDWVADNKPEWTLLEHIPNKYPFTGDTRTSSFADFYIYSRQQIQTE